MLAIVLTVTVLLIISAYRVGSITLGLSKAVSTSSGSYTLTVATPRGTLYDCNMNKITNTASKRVAVLIPTTDTVADVTNQLGDGAKSILDRLKSGKPIVAEAVTSIASRYCWLLLNILAIRATICASNESRR